MRKLTGNVTTKLLLPVFFCLAQLACAQSRGATLTVEAHNKDRRHALAEYELPGSGPFCLVEQWSGKEVACQVDEEGSKSVLRWVIPHIPAGKSISYELKQGRCDVKGMNLQNLGEYLSVERDGKEFTRYHYKGLAEKHLKPFFYPVIAHGVPVTRAFPMEQRAGESTDHKHHTSLYFTHGDVNGRDYWHKELIRHIRFLKREAGPACARIVAENQWGGDAMETQDVMILNAGEDVVMDWTITLKALQDVKLGKTKEGGFTVRTHPAIKVQGGGKMVDSKGHDNEPAIRDDAAPWVDFYGKAEGKPMGIAIMNHTTSWRHPTNWHVRSYGLFAANAFYVKGDHNMKKGDEVTLKYRLYVHAGDPRQGNVADVYEAYENPPKVSGK